MSRIIHRRRPPVVDHSDIVNTLIAVGTVAATAVLGLFTWLWRHSTRLTSAEVNIKNNQDNIRQTALRSDTQHAQIMASLTRLEDKLDRKVDR